MIRSPDSSATTRPPRMTSDPVGEPQDLLDLVGDEQDRDAARGELDEQLVDVALGADVDAAGRLVGDEHRRVGEQGAREHELLLVAAGQRRRDGLELARGGDLAQRLLGAGRLQPAADEAEPAERAAGWRG